MVLGRGADASEWNREGGTVASHRVPRIRWRWRWWVLMQLSDELLRSWFTIKNHQWHGWVVYSRDRGGCGVLRLMLIKCEWWLFYMAMVGWHFGAFFSSFFLDFARGEMLLHRVFICVVRIVWMVSGIVRSACSKSLGLELMFKNWPLLMQWFWIHVSIEAIVSLWLGQFKKI